MKDTGYKGEFAGGVEAVASNGGQIVPPIMGATAFVMAEMTGISYLEICFASLLPAVLYYCGLYAQVDLEALKLQLRGLPREELPKIKDVLKRGWQYLVPLIALILFLAVFRYTPERSAVYAMGILILASMVNKESRMGPTKILSALEGAGKAMCIVTISCAIAGFIIGSLLITGVGINLAIGIVDLSGGNPYFLALITAIICFILGMGMGTITIYLMLAVLVSPTLVEMGAPLIAAHLFVLYWGLVSFLTPPVCVAAFVAAGIAKSHPMRTGWNATRLGIVTYIVPFMFLFCPQLVMIGSPGEIGLAVITSLTGVLILSAGVVGRLYIDVGALSIVERILFIAASLLLIKPALVSDVIGVGIVIPIIVFRFILKKRTEAKAEVL